MSITDIIGPNGENSILTLLLKARNKICTTFPPKRVLKSNGYLTFLSEGQFLEAVKLRQLKIREIESKYMGWVVEVLSSYGKVQERRLGSQGLVQHFSILFTKDLIFWIY